jgi:D-alanyl-D-alanine carboxypeptidase
LKLHVLYALGEAVAAGKVSWDQPLTVTAKLTSVPSGVLQNEPDGTQLTVLDAATKMITISRRRREDRAGPPGRARGVGIVEVDADGR